MALPWHIPLEYAPDFNKHIKAPEPSLLKHYCNLNINKIPCDELQTGLMCDITIDNAEHSSIIQRFIGCGMTIARLSLRNIEQESCSQIIQSIRQAVYNYSAELQYVYPLAILVDIKGPHIVTGDLKGGINATVEIIKDDTIRLTNDCSWRSSGTSDCLFVTFENLTDLHQGDIIYMDSINSSNIKLIVLEVGTDSVECKVVYGGIIGSKMQVRVAHIPKKIDSIIHNGGGDSHESLSCSSASSDKKPFESIEEQLKWAISVEIDGVVVPNTQNSSDIERVKELLSEKGKHILIFASLETAFSVENIDEILSVADGILLDRNILGMDLPIEKITIAQKIITAKCNATGKPCMCKTVINEEIPFLCVNDTVNLVLDGVDVLSLELDYDSPLKKCVPTNDAIRMAEHCLAAAAVICRNAEGIQWQPKTYGNIELMQNPLEEPSKAICISAVELAMRASASVIVCLTKSGRTVKILSQAKPCCPIVAVTRTCQTARQLRFWRGARAVHYFEQTKSNWIAEVESRIRAALDYCKIKRIVRPGDSYVILAGSRRGMSYCDSLRLLYASTRNTVIYLD